MESSHTEYEIALGRVIARQDKPNGLPSWDSCGQWDAKPSRVGDHVLLQDPLDGAPFGQSPKACLEQQEP